MPGSGASAGGKGNIHLGRWFEGDDDKPKVKAVRQVPKLGGGGAKAGGKLGGKPAGKKPR